MPFDRCGGLCHLHQRHNSLLHSRTAGTAEQKYRQPQFCRLFNCPGDFLADHMPHASHHKFGFADADHSLFPVNLAFTYGHSFFHAGFFPGLRQLFFIALIVQWIALFYLLEPRLKAFPVCHHADPVVGLHPKIITTLIADIFIFRCPVSVYHFLTFRAFDLCFCIYTSHTCTSYSASLLSLCPAHKKSLPQIILILTQR